ncbi:MAG: hypothetical protein NVSMB47_08810 [Polyangiales bacterium]
MKLPHAFALALALFVVPVACHKETRWDEAGQNAETKAQEKKPEGIKAGSAFNKFFPADGAEGMQRVYTQEKEGFAEAKLQKDGKDVATLSISDTLNNADAKTKFASATEKVGAHPYMTVGKNQSTALVADRYQVKVSSQTLDEPTRKAWISRFDLSGLSSL